MRDREQHVSDHELLLAWDGERGHRADRVRSHLEACARCRRRAGQMETILGELAQVQRSLPELPPIGAPRARLRTRLAELAGEKPSFFSPHRLSGGFLAAALGAVALAAVILFGGMPRFRHSARTAATLPLPSSGVLPNRVFTPGAARPASLAAVCSLAHEEVVKPVSRVERQRVFAEYGIPAAQSGKYEVDYLITPGLGGEDDLRNLWPEPYDAGTWNAHAKDALEERLHEMVCSRQLNLSAAQTAISTNWIAAYRKYVNGGPAKTGAPRAASLTQLVSAAMMPGQ